MSRVAAVVLLLAACARAEEALVPTDTTPIEEPLHDLRVESVAMQGGLLDRAPAVRIVLRGYKADGTWAAPTVGQQQRRVVTLAGTAAVALMRTINQSTGDVRETVLEALSAAGRIPTGQVADALVSCSGAGTLDVTCEVPTWLLDKPPAITEVAPERIQLDQVRITYAENGEPRVDVAAVPIRQGACATGSYYLGETRCVDYQFGLVGEAAVEANAGASGTLRSRVLELGREIDALPAGNVVEQ